MLFYAPDIHLRTLEELWMDRLLAKEAWTKAVQKFISEWIETTTYVRTHLLRCAPGPLTRIFDSQQSC